MKIGKLNSRLKKRIKRRDHQVRRFKKTHEAGHAKAARREAKAVRYLRHLLREAIRKANRRQKGLDWAWGDISSTAMRAAGYTFACRYLSHDASKNLTRQEAEEHARHGISNVVVWESGGTRALEGFAAGAEDAHAALKMALACGKPYGSPIFFAIDFESSGADVKSYFEGVRSVLAHDEIGAYGGLGAISYLFDHDLIRYGWQTYAWSGGQWDDRAHLRQFSNEHTFEGVGVDYNHSTKPDFGQWSPTKGSMHQ